MMHGKQLQESNDNVGTDTYYLEIHVVDKSFILPSNTIIGILLLIAAYCAYKRYKKNQACNQAQNEAENKGTQVVINQA